MRQLDQFAIRKHNILRILELLSGRSPMTRQELAEETGLSLMTMTNLVDHLKRYDALTFSPLERETSAAHRIAGRKADSIALSTKRHAWLVIDLSDVHFRFSLLALDLSTLGGGTAWAYHPADGYLQNLMAFLGYTRSYLAQTLENREVLGVAVVTPGPYDIVSDTVANQRVPELNALKIKQTLTEGLGAYDYYVDEDVKFAVRAFLPTAKQGGLEVLYYLYIGEGVGGAAVHNGNVLRGLNAAAGDAGQLLSGDGARYESLISLRAFARSLRLSALENVSEDELLTRLNALAEERPGQYMETLLRAADIVADMLRSVVWLLDPVQVVVDCRYARSMQEMFIGRIAGSLHERLGGALPKRVCITAAPRDGRCVIRGAAQVLCREWVERIV